MMGDGGWCGKPFRCVISVCGRIRVLLAVRSVTPLHLNKTARVDRSLEGTKGHLPLTPTHPPTHPVFSRRIAYTPGRFYAKKSILAGHPISAEIDLNSNSRGRVGVLLMPPNPPTPTPYYDGESLSALTAL